MLLRKVDLMYPDQNESHQLDCRIVEVEVRDTF